MSVKTVRYKDRYCDECGAAYTPGRKDERFCCLGCRKAFENRRMKRGAQIYDLFCVMRRERDLAQKLGIWKEMCRVEQRWREEDKLERGDRRSYRAPGVALEKLRGDGRLRIADRVGWI